MSDAICPFDERTDRAVAEAPEPDATLGHIRVSGGVRVKVDARHGPSRVANLHERDGYKVRFPRRAYPPEAIIINTGGGLAGGDSVCQEFDIGDGAALTVTTQASERSYRALAGATTGIDIRATVGCDATLNWLPQETILFDGTRLVRKIEVDLHASARVLIAETVVFGRLAMGERLETGFFADHWRIRRDHHLVFAENVKLSDDAFQLMTLAALSGGAHIATTLVLLAPNAEDLLLPARSALADCPFDCAASAWNGMLVMRGLAHRTEDVHRTLAKLLTALDAGPLPRVWST